MPNNEVQKGEEWHVWVETQSIWGKATENKFA